MKPLELIRNLNQDFCFACLKLGYVERCHIKAKVLGGKDKVENIHLLCPVCHSDSEMKSGLYYWCWFKTIDVHGRRKLYETEAANLSGLYQTTITKLVKNYDLDSDAESLFYSWVGRKITELSTTEMVTRLQQLQDSQTRIL